MFWVPEKVFLSLNTGYNGGHLFNDISKTITNDLFPPTPNKVEF